MKYFRQLPWQIQWALFSPFFLLIIFSATQSIRTYREWRIRTEIEQALASFDPDVMAFTITAEGSVGWNYVYEQKTSTQLTLEQRRLVGRWIDSFHYSEPYADPFIGGGRRITVEFHSPQGAVSAHDATCLQAPRKQLFPFAPLLYHDSFEKILYEIQTTGILPERSRDYIAVFHNDWDSLGAELWKIIVGPQV